MSSFRNDQSAEILGSVYRNAEMAYEASGDVLKRCPNRKLAGEINSPAPSDTARWPAQTRSELVRRGAVPKDYPPYAKMMSRMGIAMRTANDRSSKNIASLMIKGTTMGIIDMQHAVNRSHQAEGKIRADAQQLLRREQDFCDHLKDYV